MILLGVNVDHVATIRQARKTIYPSPYEAAVLAIEGGADQITIHLREDRRHIVDDDVSMLRSSIKIPLNLEMAIADEIVDIACTVKPDTCTLVPEKRQELTTEGGLDIVTNFKRISAATKKLSDAKIAVSMFIDPELVQVDATIEAGSRIVEFHTGSYCDAADENIRNSELERLQQAVRYAKKKGLKVCAGHGINYENAGLIARALPEVEEYNIGHAIVARAIMVGIQTAVREIKEMLIEG